MSSLIASVLSAVAAIAGVYAIAAIIAAPTPADFNAADPIRRTAIVEYGIALKRAADQHRTERAKCETLTGAEKSGCQAEARSAQIRAKAAARANHRGHIQPATQTGVNDTHNAHRKDGELDVALYRAHRQLPDEQSVCFGSEATDVDLQPGKKSARIAMR